MKPSPLATAVELLATGAWQQAHAIVQREKSALAAWLHGIVHTLEGDLDNARYWYRKARRAFPGRDAVQTEIADARRMMVEGGTGASGRTRPQKRQRSRKRTATT